MIRCAVDFCRTLQEKFPHRKWLVVGKGPTSDYVSRVDPAKHRVLTLNHACKVIHFDIAHFVDLEALAKCEEYLLLGTGVVCLPWHPHSNNKPTVKTLEQWCDEIPVLYDLASQGRVVSYDAAKAVRPTPGLQRIRLKKFSVVGAFNLLAAAGAKSIDSIGVDGGKEYGQSFDPSDKFSNGQKTFDVQTPELQSTVQTNNIKWRRLYADAGKHLG